MKIRITLDNTILFFTFVLLVFHTFTFFQVYYNFTITLTLFAFISILSLIKSKGKIVLSKQSGLITLSLFTFLIIFIGCFVKNHKLLNMIGAYFPYILWPIIYSITEPIFSKKSKKIFIMFFLASLSISVLATLSVVLTDNSAARLLAGAASSAIRNSYYKKGVGGYGFVYGCVFIVYALILMSKVEENKLIKTFLLTLILVSLIMIVYASYTLALLATIILIFLTFYVQSRSKYATLTFVLSVIAIIVLIHPILVLLQNFAASLNLEWIENRVGQLISADDAGSLGNLKRIKLYSISLNSFRDNILIGAGRVGGHSMFFDNIGMYGLFGLLFCISYFSTLNGVRKRIKGKSNIAIYLFIALMLINTTDTIVLLPMVLYMLPLLLSFIEEKEALYEKNITN